MPALEYGSYYHIYNRGNNRENLFVDEDNYPYFLRLYKKYIPTVASTFAYCLLRNHFHLLVRIKPNEEQNPIREGVLPDPSRHFSNLFNAYAKAINKRYPRCGSLFQDRFRRKEIKDPASLIRLIYYIHRNPVKHHFSADLSSYPYSSYKEIVSGQCSLISRDEVVNLFGGIKKFVEFHKTMREESEVENDDR
jgi:putative transposase